ncbi:MAG: ion channel, partial [Candidatus Methanoperedens sp.]|nr:ion channel [Candidatus Methanoperedens sp.]
MFFIANKKFINIRLSIQSHMYYLRLPRGIPANLKISIVLLILIVLVGTAGFQILEGVDSITSLYWTIVTVATIVYGDVVPHTMGG